MSPSDIAREAAEAIFMPRSRSVHSDPDTAHELRIEECSALILSAAAKMVRETGAVGLLGVAKCPNCNGQGWYEDVAANVHTGEAEQIQQQCQWCDEKNAALQSLRSLTEHKP